MTWRMRWLAALVAVPAWTVHAPVTAAPAPPPVPTTVQIPLGSAAPDTGAGVIVRFRSPTALDAAEAQLDQRGAPATDRFDAGINALVVDADNPELARLVQSPQVVSVEPDRLYSIGAVTSWGLDRIDQRSLPLNNASMRGASGSGVTAYIIDTGLNLTHQEFAGRVPRAFFASSFTDAVDCNGHGTHVAGTVGGATFGVAPLATIVPIRVFGCSGNASGSDILTALERVVTDHLPGVPAVLNMSLGGTGSDVLDAAVNSVVADGVTVVVAAGNDAVDACNDSPGRAPNAITVAASTSADARASFSNFGTCVDLFAPGQSIASAFIGSNTAAALMSGTSMASPHVAGAVALYLAGHPSATPAQVAAAIDTNATTGALSGLQAGDPNKLLYVDPVALTVSSAGAGTGTITTPLGINCGLTCSTTVARGTPVTLTAAAAAGSVFTGWSGGGCTGIGTCLVAVDAPTSITATFALAKTLTVSRSGAGSGTVTSNIGGVNCGATCSTSQVQGTAVTLSAVAAFGSAFSGWSGSGCSGTGTCTVTLNDHTTVTATFTLVPRLLTVAVTGLGTITSNVGGIDCGTTCNATVGHGTTVTLTATASAGAQFTGWSGGGCGTSPSCAVTVTGDQLVTATFAPVFQSFTEPVRLFDTRPGNTGVLETSVDETTRFAPGRCGATCPVRRSALPAMRCSRSTWSR